MARKGRKTRWRKLPIPIGGPSNHQQNQGGPGGGGGVGCHQSQCDEEGDTGPDEAPIQSQKETVSRVTFNQDEYTKITTPRQDMLFKKGYLGRKKPQAQETYLHPEPLPPQSPSESMEGEQYLGCEDGMPLPAPYVYPSGYIDQNGLFYLNGGSYEVYDPYTGNLTVIVGPGGGYPAQAMLTPIPCHPVPLQPVEWFNPQQPQWHQQTTATLKKRNSTDSQNWGSSQSCESPASPPETSESQEPPLFYPQYVYPGYMFGAPVYNVNGVNVQGAVAPAQTAPTAQPVDPPKRRKKRRKKRRQGVGDEGSESSCEEQGGSGGSGGSSDIGQGSSCSKTTDSGVHTANSGADSPQPAAQPNDSPSDSADSQPSSPVALPLSDATRGSSNNSFEETTEEVAGANKNDESDEGVSEASTFAEGKLCEDRWTSVEEQVNTVEERSGPENCQEERLNILDSRLEERLNVPDSKLEERLVIPEKESPDNKPEQRVSTPDDKLDERLSTLDKKQEERLGVPDEKLEPDNKLEERLSIPSDKLEESLNTSDDKLEERLSLPDDKPEERLSIPNDKFEERLSTSDDKLKDRLSLPDDKIEERLSITNDELEERLSIPENKIEERLCLPEDKPKEILIIPENQLEERFNFPESILEERLNAPENKSEEWLNFSDESSEEKVYSLQSINEITIENGINKPDTTVKIVQQMENQCCLQEVDSDIKTINSEELWSTAVETVTESLPQSTKAEGKEDCLLLREETVLCSKELLVKQQSDEQWNNAEDTDLVDEGLKEETEVRWNNDDVNSFAEPEEIWGSAEEANASTDIEDRWQFAETDLGIDALGETKPITEAVTRWLETQGTLVVAQPAEESEDEGIGDDSCTTGPKNAHGNPFLVPYHSTGTRVANCEEEKNDWSVWAAKCDPAASVDRYYRLAAESPPQLKTATVHIHPSTPFPCGLVCCILQ